MSVNLITEILGADADTARISTALLAGKINGETYTEATFKAHLEAIVEYGDGYLSFVENLAGQPALSTMYGFVISGGPDGG